jgi:hypothetical protein
MSSYFFLVFGVLKGLQQITTRLKRTESWKKQGRLEEIKQSRGNNQGDEKKTVCEKVKHGKEIRKESLRTSVPT